MTDATIFRIIKHTTDLLSIRTFTFPDQIAMPRLAVTAMENWGLVTYDESDFLYKEERSSKFQKENIATLIAHELAHQVCL